MAGRWRISARSADKQKNLDLMKKCNNVSFVELSHSYQASNELTGLWGSDRMSECTKKKQASKREIALVIGESLDPFQSEWKCDALCFFFSTSCTTALFIYRNNFIFWFLLVFALISCCVGRTKPIYFWLTLLLLLWLATELYLGLELNTHHSHLSIYLQFGKFFIVIHFHLKRALCTRTSHSKSVVLSKHRQKALAPLHNKGICFFLVCVQHNQKSAYFKMPFFRLLASPSDA